MIILPPALKCSSSIELRGKNLGCASPRTLGIYVLPTDLINVPFPEYRSKKMEKVYIRNKIEQMC